MLRDSEGEFQSGATEFGLATSLDESQFVIVSSVNGDACCAITAMFLGYAHLESNQAKKIKSVKARVVTKEQLKRPIALFSHGGFTNPDMFCAQLTHCAVFRTSNANNINHQ
jgi:hypothetical protein